MLRRGEHSVPVATATLRCSTRHSACLVQGEVYTLGPQPGSTIERNYLINTVEEFNGTNPGGSHPNAVYHDSKMRARSRSVANLKWCSMCRRLRWLERHAQCDRGRVGALLRSRPAGWRLRARQKLPWNARRTRGLHGQVRQELSAPAQLDGCAVRRRLQQEALQQRPLGRRQ